MKTYVIYSEDNQLAVTVATHRTGSTKMHTYRPQSDATVKRLDRIVASAVYSAKTYLFDDSPRVVMVRW